MRTISVQVQPDHLRRMTAVKRPVLAVTELVWNGLDADATRVRVILEKDKLGLMAEDFHQVFKRGSDTTINGQEVQMALWLAVQELEKRTIEQEKQDTQIAKQDAQIAALAEENQEMKVRIERLEALIEKVLQ